MHDVALGHAAALSGALSDRAHARLLFSIVMNARTSTALRPSPAGPASPCTTSALRAAARSALLAFVLVLGAGSGAVVHAQFLADTLVATAIASQLYPGVQFPSGTLRAVEAPPSLIARVPDAAAWTSWEAYTARGLGTRLVPAHIHQLTNAFAVAGFFEASRSEAPVGDEVHTRTEFAGPDGGRALLYVIRRGDDIAWLVARQR